MKPEEFKSLSTGDIVRHARGSSSFVVTYNYGDRVTAVRTADLTNPSEWDLCYKANPKPPSDMRGPEPVVRHAGPRLCLSWRNPGKFWKLSEGGQGEKLHLSHASRGDVAELDDEDLEELASLVQAAIEYRRANPPHQK